MAKRKVQPDLADPNIAPNLGAPNTNPQSVPYSPGQIEQQDGGGGEGIVPTANQAWWDQVDQNNENAIFGTLSHPGSFTRWGVEQYLEYQANQAGEQKLSAEEARKRYPGVEFTGDVSPSIAQYRADVINRQRTMQDFISRAPEQPSGISTGIASILTSPADLLAGIGVGRLAGAALGGLTKVGTVGELVAPRAILGAGGHFVENLAGNAIYQGANAALKIHEGQHIEPNDEFNSAVGNALFFTALDAAVVRPFSRFLAKRFPRDLQEQAVRENLAREEQGLPPGAPAAQATSLARVSGLNQDGAVPVYTIDKNGHPSERAYYQSVHGDTGELVDFTGREVGQTYIDHPEQARNAVENPDGAAQGQVMEGQIDPRSKFLNLDEKLDAKNMEIAKQIEKGLGVDLKLDPSMTLQQVLETVPHANQMGVAELIQGQGFDGYKETVETGGGGEHTAVTVFQNDQQNGRFYPSEDQPTIPGGAPKVPTEEVALDVSDPKSQAGYDEPLVMEAKRIFAETPKTPQAELSAIKEQELTARRLLSKVEEDSAIGQQIVEIDQDANMEAKARQALKSFAECFAGGLQ